MPMHLMIAAAPFFAFPSFETLRFATLLRMRWKSEQPTKHSQPLRNGAKRSVSKGGNRHGAYAPHDRGSSVLRVPIVRDAPLRYAPQDKVKKRAIDKTFTTS